MCPYTYYNVMRESKDPRQLRYQVVLSVEKRGIKPTLRHFSEVDPSVKTAFFLI